MRPPRRSPPGRPRARRARPAPVGRADSLAVAVAVGPSVRGSEPDDDATTAPRPAAPAPRTTAPKPSATTSPPPRPRPAARGHDVDLQAREVLRLTNLERASAGCSPARLGLAAGHRRGRSQHRHGERTTTSRTRAATAGPSRTGSRRRATGGPGSRRTSRWGSPPRRPSWPPGWTRPATARTSSTAALTELGVRRRAQWSVRQRPLLDPGLRRAVLTVVRREPRRAVPRPRRMSHLRTGPPRRPPVGVPAVLAAVLLAGCAGPAPVAAPSTSPVGDPDALLAGLVVQGGMCAEGPLPHRVHGAAGRRLAGESGHRGTGRHGDAGGCTAGRASVGRRGDRTRRCSTVHRHLPHRDDGQELVVTWTEAATMRSASSCEVEFPAADPLPEALRSL